MKTEEQKFTDKREDIDPDHYETDVILLEHEKLNEEESSDRKFVVLMGGILAVVGAVIFGVLSPITLVGIEIYWWNPIIGGFLGALFGAIIGIILDSFLNASGVFRRKESV